MMSAVDSAVMVFYAHDFPTVSEILDRREIWAKIKGLADLPINRHLVESCETGYF